MLVCVSTSLTFSISILPSVFSLVVSLEKKTSSAFGHALRGLQDRPSCPDQDPCYDLGDGWFGYHVSKTNSTDNTCQERCAAGSSLTNYLENEGYECGACVRPSCPNQEVCRDFGNGYLGYSVHRSITEDGTCEERCAAGNSLAQLLFSGYACGACPRPSCPNQEPCYDYGDGWLGYTIHRPRDITNSLCVERCSTGNSLAAALFSGKFVCGPCPEGTKAKDVSCPGQVPCRDFGNGFLGYSVSRVNATDGTCRGVCAAGQSLIALLDEGYECGECTSPSCPNQEVSCGDFNGFRGYRIHRFNETDGRCQPACAAGNTLARLLFTASTLAVTALSHQCLHICRKRNRMTTRSPSTKWTSLERFADKKYSRQLNNSSIDSSSRIDSVDRTFFLCSLPHKVTYTRRATQYGIWW